MTKSFLKTSVFILPHEDNKGRFQKCPLWRAFLKDGFSVTGLTGFAWTESVETMRSEICFVRSIESNTSDANKLD